MGEYYDPCLLSICYHSKRERVDLANVSQVAKVMISHKLTKSCFTSQQRRDVVLCQRGFLGCCYIYHAVDYSTRETPRLMCDFDVGTVLYLEHIPLLAQL